MESVRLRGPVPKRKKGQERKIARERIDALFRLAEQEALKGKLDRANRYVELGRRIGMRYTVRLPSEYKRRVCKGCHAYLLPPKTARVRVRDARVVTTCLACGTVMRFPYVREQKARRAQ
jgi:ribonuclease P protein subunit RPR2